MSVGRVWMSVGKVWMSVGKVWTSVGRVRDVEYGGERGVRGAVQRYSQQGLYVRHQAPRSGLALQAVD